MPDSQQPPFRGPAYHERDLDALLSGEPGSTPPALRPVESTLAALRAAPTPRELWAEADARAAFRALTLPPSLGVSPPLPLSAPQAALSTSPQAALSISPQALPEHEAATEHTLVLPLAEHLLAVTDGRPARGRRPRHRRRAAVKGGHRSVIALTSVAAAAVVVIAVAVSGALPGSFGQIMTSSGHHASSSASATAKAGQVLGGSLDGTGRARPSPSVTVTATPTSQPSVTPPVTICRAWIAAIRQRDRKDEHALFSQLIPLAGGQDNVWGYCNQVLRASGDKGQPYPAPSYISGGHPGGRGGDPGRPGAGYPGGNTSGGNTATASPTASAGTTANAAAGATAGGHR